MGKGATNDNKIKKLRWKTQKPLRIYEAKDTERQQVSLTNMLFTFFKFIFPNSPNNTSILLKNS